MKRVAWPSAIARRARLLALVAGVSFAVAGPSFALAAAASVASAASVNDPARAARLEDFDAFCRFVQETYAYFDRKKTDWAAVCTAARQPAADAADRDAFVGVVERALGELYDAHAHLGTSNARSPRLVPTDSDLYAEWRGDDAVIVAVRAGSSASVAGLEPGMRVTEIDGRSVRDAVDAAMPKHLTAFDPAARDWALRSVLAGRQDGRPVHVQTEEDGVRRRFAFDPKRIASGSLLSTRRLGTTGDVAIVTVHNALGDPKLVGAFDDALASLGDVRALVLDLRDTPSGGTTTVARGLMGRLVDHEAAYQRHERIDEERESGIRHVWVEYVEPRAPVFDRPVVVLVGRWTGSMGEGIAIGLHAAAGVPVVGSPMAGLLGALDEITLAHAKFAVRVPAEKLFTVDGTPRETFTPCPLPAAAPDSSRNADDEALEAARIALARIGTASPTSASERCRRP